MKRILVSGDLTRPDFMEVLKTIYSDFDTYFLAFGKERFSISPAVHEWGSVIFWEDFHGALDLIHKVRPQKTLFFDYEMYNQMALLVTCKREGIETMFIEHGLRLKETFTTLQALEKSQRRILVDRIKKLRWVRRLLMKTNRFYYSTVRNSYESDREFLVQFFNYRANHTISETYLHFGSELPLPDTFITTTRSNLEFHELRHDNLIERSKIVEVGFPQFDFLVSHNSKPIPPYNQVVLIDQPFAEFGYYGWNHRRKEAFLKKLSSFFDDRDLSACVHPVSDRDLFDTLGIPVLDKSELPNIVKSSCIILGFHSTLLLPLASMANTVLFTLDMHPEPPKVSSVKFLVEAKVVEKVSSFDELKKSFLKLEQIANNQVVHKRAFEQKWLLELDGKSGLRIRTAISNI